MSTHFVEVRGRSPDRQEMLNALLETHRPGFGLARDLYVDSAVFDAELEAIWYREWLLAGMACELPMPYQWITFEVGRASIVIIRGEDGRLRAFHNNCRHRGSRVSSAASRPSAASSAA